MAKESSLPHSQKHAFCSYPEADQSIPRTERSPFREAYFFLSNQEIFRNFMATESSLPHSQQHTFYSYPVPDEPIPHPEIIFFKVPF